MQSQNLQFQFSIPSPQVKNRASNSRVKKVIKHSRKLQTGVLRRAFERTNANWKDLWTLPPVRCRHWHNQAMESLVLLNQHMLPGLWSHMSPEKMGKKIWIKYLGYPVFIIGLYNQKIWVNRFLQWRTLHLYRVKWITFRIRGHKELLEWKHEVNE